MGLGIAAVQLNLELWQRGLFKDIQSVMDIGAQELHLKRQDFEDLLHCAKVTDEERNLFAGTRAWPASAEAFYKILGARDYSCIDLNGRYGAVVLDLNYPLKDKALYHKYDLVADHGSCEHAFNVAEAYRSMHWMCKPQGVITIVQALWRGNGYYLFDRPFFEGIAAANNYKTIFSSYIVTLAALTPAGRITQFHIPLSQNILDCIDLSKVNSIEICYVFQKHSDADFRFPYQPDYLSLLKQTNGNFGMQHSFGHPSSSRAGTPVYEPVLECIKTKVLLRHISQRLFGRAKRMLRLKQ